MAAGTPAPETPEGTAAPHTAPPRPTAAAATPTASLLSAYPNPPRPRRSARRGTHSPTRTIGTSGSAEAGGRRFVGGRTGHRRGVLSRAGQRGHDLPRRVRAPRLGRDAHRHAGREVEPARHRHRRG